MPDLPECTASPFRDSFFRGAALITGHRRYCDLINPDHPDYNPAIAAEYGNLSMILEGRVPAHEWVNPYMVGLEAKPRNWPGGRPNVEIRPDVPATGQGLEHKPKDWPKPGFTPKGMRRSIETIPLRMVNDDRIHRSIYMAARDCPFRKSSCCSQDRCGPGGAHQGEPVSIGVCYPCRADAMGIELD